MDNTQSNQMDNKQSNYMDNKQSKQTIYIRKSNGIGQKIIVQPNTTINQLKQIIRSLKSIQIRESSSRQFNKESPSRQFGKESFSRQFSLVFKGKNITDKGQCTLREIDIVADAIVHVVYVSEEERRSQNSSREDSVTDKKDETTELDSGVSYTVRKPSQLKLRVMFNNIEHSIITNVQSTVLQLKKRIAMKLNLIYQSLILCHLGSQMLDQRYLSDYQLENQTLVSLKFNLQKTTTKKLQTRMVSSVTLSQEDKTVNVREGIGRNLDGVGSSGKRNVGLGMEDMTEHRPMKLMSLFNNKKNNMYKSQITTLTQQPNSYYPTELQCEYSPVIGHSFSPMINNNYSSQIANTFPQPNFLQSGSGNFPGGSSKAALMFQNALHQKITETQSVVSETFSQDTTFSGCDPNCVLVTVKNQEDTKEFVFECNKTHQIVNIKEKLLKVERIPNWEKLEISMEEDLFQSIDLSKSGCVTLCEIVKKMGKERAVFIYRII